jgi:hypothetical protein
MPAEQNLPALDYEDPTLPNASIGAPAKGDPNADTHAPIEN